MLDGVIRANTTRGMPQRIHTDHDRGTQQNLKLSIMAIDRGIGVVAGTGYALETLRLGALMKESGCRTAARAIWRRWRKAMVGRQRKRMEDTCSLAAC
jgi:hypothetical protein